MSPLQERIDEDYKEAFKRHDAVPVMVLRMLKSAIKNAEIDLRHEINDEEIITVLTREAKKRREAAELYIKGGRQDLADKEKAEVEIISKYLPAQLSDEELEKIAKEVVQSSNAVAKDFGKVIGMVMEKVKGQADGNRVSAIVKKILTPN